MMKKLKERLNNQKGLTLIELLAVLVILGIIAAIAIPAIGNIIDNSRFKAIKSDAIMVINAARMYHADTGELPPPAAEGEESVSEELNSYLEGSISLKGVKIVRDGDGEYMISATGTIGDVQVQFENATIAEINEKEKFENPTEGEDGVRKVTITGAAVK